MTSTYTSGISPCQQRTVWHPEGIWIRHGISSFAASMAVHGRLKSINDQCMESRWVKIPGTSWNIPGHPRLQRTLYVKRCQPLPLISTDRTQLKPKKLPHLARRTHWGNLRWNCERTLHRCAMHLSIQDRHRNLMNFANFALYVESSFDHHLEASWSGRLISGQGSQSLHSASAQDRA